MPASCSILGCLDVAGRLERELATIGACVDELAASIECDPRVTLLQRSLVLAAGTACAMRRFALDAATNRSDAQLSVHGHERAMRARLNLLMRALCELRRRESEVPDAALAGRFRCVRDVCTHVIDHTAQIHARWQDRRDSDRMLEDDGRRAAAYAAFDDAEIAFERLGRDADVDRFLGVGASCESEPVIIACREIAAALGVAMAVATPGEDPADGDERVRTPSVSSECAS